LTLDHTNWVVCRTSLARTWYIYLHTTFGDTRFSRSGDMIAGVEIDNVSWEHDHAPLGMVCRS